MGSFMMPWKTDCVMQALREELRRQRCSVRVTSDKDEGTHLKTELHIDAEHNRQLENQIAEYSCFIFGINTLQWSEKLMFLSQYTMFAI